MSHQIGTLITEVNLGICQGTNSSSTLFLKHRWMATFEVTGTVRLAKFCENSAVNELTYLRFGISEAINVKCNT
ncbi:hypothetical protein GBA52_007892 [Prunus armeniaca]|nr:hypothetical protein GBA52_007892 [Prunus armeniaca]